MINFTFDAHLYRTRWSTNTESYAAKTITLQSPVAQALHTDWGGIDTNHLALMVGTVKMPLATEPVMVQRLEWNGKTTDILWIDIHIRVGVDDQVVGFDTYYVELGGDPLPDFANLAAWQAFLASTQQVNLTTGPFRVARDFPWAEAAALTRMAGDGFGNTLNGAQHDDLIAGLGGSDVVHGNGGNDTVQGGDGVDVLYGDAGADRLVGGTGTDRLWGGVGNDYAQGDAQNDTLYGGDGNDSLYGNDGADTLNGDDGADKLWGGAGVDLLRGGAGADRLDGGEGADQMRGGTGADAFVFGDGGGNDKVLDFSRGDGDAVTLDADLWTGTKSAAQVVAQFAHVTANGVLFDFGGGDTLLLQGLGTTTGLAAFVDIL